MQARLNNEIKKTVMVKDALKMDKHKPPSGVLAPRDPAQELLDNIDRKNRKMNRALSSKKKPTAKENKP